MKYRADTSISLDAMDREQIEKYYGPAFESLAESIIIKQGLHIIPKFYADSDTIPIELLIRLFSKYIKPTDNNKRYLSSNSQVTWATIYSTDNALWDWKTISKHPCITLEIVLAHMDTFPLSLELFCQYNPNFIIEELLESGYGQGLWPNITARDDITWTQIKEHSSYPWESYYLLGKPDTPAEVIIEIMRSIWEYNTCDEYDERYIMEIVSGRLDIPWKFIIDTLDIIPWFADALSSRNDITPEIIETLLKTHNSYVIFPLINPANMTLYFIKKYISEAWDWVAIYKCFGPLAGGVIFRRKYKTHCVESIIAQELPESSNIIKYQTSETSYKYNFYEIRELFFQCLDSYSLPCTKNQLKTLITGLINYV